MHCSVHVHRPLAALVCFACVEVGLPADLPVVPALVQGPCLFEWQAMGRVNGRLYSARLWSADTTNTPDWVDCLARDPPIAPHQAVAAAARCLTTEFGFPPSSRRVDRVAFRRLSKSDGGFYLVSSCSRLDYEMSGGRPDIVRRFEVFVLLSGNYLKPVPDSSGVQLRDRTRERPPPAGGWRPPPLQYASFLGRQHGPLALYYDRLVQTPDWNPDQAPVPPVPLSVLGACQAGYSALGPGLSHGPGCVREVKLYRYPWSDKWYYMIAFRRDDEATTTDALALVLLDGEARAFPLAAPQAEPPVLRPPPPWPAIPLPARARPPSLVNEQSTGGRRGESWEGKAGEADQKSVPHDSDEPMTISISAENSDVEDVIMVFAHLLGFNWEKAGALAGKLTSLKMDKEVTGRELWALFDSILAMNGVRYEERQGKLVFTQTTEPREADAR